MIPEPSTRQKYFFHKLKNKGDFIEIEASGQYEFNSIRAAAYIWAKKNGKKVATRKYDGGMRVYLAEHV